MTHFSDLHIHGLYGVDDGAKTKEDMFSMVDIAYNDGTRYLCLTPHFHPGFFPKSTREYTGAVYQELQEYVQHNLPDMHLAIGNELRYSKDCVSWLNDGYCRTLNDTDYVLVDFLEHEEASVITKGLEQLLNAGYIPVLAHIERYRKLNWNLKELKSFSTSGVLLQMNVQSIIGENGFLNKEHCKRIIKSGFVDFISSDAHNLTARPPKMQPAYNYLQKIFDSVIADQLCITNAQHLLWKTSLKGS